MKATIKDVARRAGVSIATVSYAINNTRVVAEETKKRITRAIGELGYTPNFRARNFKTGRSNAIGVIVPDIANLFFATVIEEIENTVSRFNYTLTIANTKETKSRECNALQYFSTGIVDGIILASTFDNYAELAPALPRDIPVVFFDRRLKDCPHDTVTVTDTPAIRQIVQQLAAKGHEKIGCIASLPRLSTTQERLAAYRGAMETCGGYADGKYVRCAASVTDSGYTQTAELLHAGCTAILVISNIMTRGTLQCILDANLVPGRDIAVAGYHNADFLMIDMICIGMPDRNLGRHAGEQMLTRLRNPDAPVQNIELVSGFEPGVL